MVWLSKPFLWFNRVVIYSSKQHFCSDLKCRSFLELAYFYKSRYDRAVADFNKCIELYPKLADAYFNKALALEAYATFLKLATPEDRDQIEQAKSKLGRR